MNKKILFLIICVVALISCNRQCPNISSVLKSYVPYKLNDVFLLENGCDTFPFYVEKYLLNEGGSISHNKESGCTSVISIEARCKPYTIYLAIRTEVECYGPYISFDFNGTCNFYDKISSSGGKELYTDSLNTYNKCYIFQSLNEKEINKVVIAPNLGIVRILFNNGEVWRLVEE
ncbi:MAG: hypothetical protein MJ069_10540 [Salinivirgaceae bacterium]|nr:hypothetical protein [Salinivirgaceae bacterium]